MAVFCVEALSVLFTMVAEKDAPCISSVNGLYLSGSIVSGASSAFLWHLWGDYYAFTRNDNGEGIAFGFGLTLLASIAITSFAPPVISRAFVAVTPLLSGGMLTP